MPIRFRNAVMCVTGIVLLLALPGNRAVAEEKKTAEAMRFTSPPVMDGKVDETCWAAAVPTEGFVQYIPQHGEPSPYRTVVRVGFDDRALYVAFVCYDPEPDRIAAAMTKRDTDLSQDDAVAIFIDALGDYTATAFVTNLLGTQWDARIIDDGRSDDSSWDDAWESAASLCDEGWSAELAIPFRILKYQGGKDRTWGVNFARACPRDLEVSYWCGTMTKETRVSQYGLLTGLDLEAPAKRFELIPYALLQVEDGEKADVEAGLDARFRITSALRADVTVNPDFATVEADAEEINLTRFELDIPEKRPFFLESAETFGQRVRQFYSRRIGDIPWGAMLNGTVGGCDLAVIMAQSDPALTDQDAGKPGSDAGYGVFRVKKGVFGTSNVGVLMTNRRWRGVDQGTIGADATLFFTGTLGMTAQFVRAHGPVDDAAVTWFVRPAFDDENSHFHVRYSHWGEGLMDNVNAVGFILDDDRKEFDTNLSHTFWFKDRVVEYVGTEVNYNRYTSQAGVLRSWELYSELECKLACGLELELDHEDEFKYEDEDTVWVEYDNHETSIEAKYDTRAGRYAGVSYGFGRNYGSDLQLIGSEVGLKVTDALNVEYSLTRLVLDPDPEDETTWIHGGRANYYFHPDLFCKLFVQTQSAIDKKNVQVSVVWRFIPPFGSLQLVYQHGTSRAGEASDQGHTLFAKLSWVF